MTVINGGLEILVLPKCRSKIISASDCSRIMTDICPLFCIIDFIILFNELTIASKQNLIFMFLILSGNITGQYILLDVAWVANLDMV